MEIEFIPVGGYGEVGKNMGLLRVGDEAVILDMGLFIPKAVSFEEEGGHRERASTLELIKYGMIPDDRVIEKYKQEVKAIVLSHAHLDHIAATQYLAPHYPQAPVITTPFSMEVLKTTMSDDNIKIPNQLKPLNLNHPLKISKNIEIELINMPHSTPQSSVVAVHTPKGTVLYGNDFKLDESPTLGQKGNVKRLKQLGKGNVIAAIVDALYAPIHSKTPSEAIAKSLLKNVMLGSENNHNALIATTFGSHLARLKSMIEFSRKLDRKVVFLGRSMKKYIDAGQKIGIINFAGTEVLGYSNMVKRKVKKLSGKSLDKYTIICTGGQGESKAVLTKMVSGALEFKFQKEDSVIFSNKVIPTEPNITSRKKLEEKLEAKKVRIFKDVHSSGHMAREDIRDFIKMTNPSIVIPAQGDHKMFSAFSELAENMGYKKNKNVFTPKDGEKLKIS
ncbi:MAG: MBL fold metallo-hydrolase [Candidatus Woesearchaeota archaeon]|nr:MAG: MBL fold metallo-hydrolase [Candidatus Woesearchaeota archaeon]